MRSVKLLFLPFIIFTFLFLTGCVQNLKTVRSFSSQTTTLSKSLESIVDDIPDSCMRRVEIIQIVSPNNELYNQSLNTCNKLKDSTNVILNYNRVLVAYSEALSAIAVDDYATYTGEFSALSTSLDSFMSSTNATDTDKAKGKASISLLKFIANAATEGYRQCELKKAFAQYKNISMITDAIKERVSFSYSSILDNELGTIKSVVQLIENEQNKQVFSSGLLKRELKLQKNEIESKREALHDYLKALDEMNNSLEKLYNSSGDLSGEEIVSLINEYGIQVYNLEKSINSAF